MKKRFAVVDTALCVAGGCCVKVCLRQAITIPKGIFAEVARAQCVGCGLCANACPASGIEIMQEDTP